MGPVLGQLQLALLLLQAGVPALPGPEPLFRQAVAMREKTLGVEHAETAEALVNLGLFLRKEGRDSDAAPVLERALTILERSPQSSQALLARLCFELGDLAAAQGAADRALMLFQKSMRLQSSAATASRTGELLQARGDAEGAEAQFKTALTLAKSPAEAAGIVNNLGLLFEAQSRGAEAEAMFARAAGLFEKAYGQRHPEFATALTNLAGAVKARGDIDTAADLLSKAIQVFESTTGTEHPHAQAACQTLMEVQTDDAAHSAARRLCMGTSLPEPTKTPIQ